MSCSCHCVVIHNITFYYFILLVGVEVNGANFTYFILLDCNVFCLKSYVVK